MASFERTRAVERVWVDDRVVEFEKRIVQLPLPRVSWAAGSHPRRSPLSHETTPARPFDDQLGGNSNNNTNTPTMS
jgi:hypothetical protein